MNKQTIEITDKYLMRCESLKQLKGKYNKDFIDDLYNLYSKEYKNEISKLQESMKKEYNYIDAYIKMKDGNLKKIQIYLSEDEINKIENNNIDKN